MGRERGLLSPPPSSPKPKLIGGILHRSTISGSSKATAASSVSSPVERKRRTSSAGFLFATKVASMRGKFGKHRLLLLERCAGSPLVLEKMISNSDCCLYLHLPSLGISPRTPRTAALCAQVLVEVLITVTVLVLDWTSTPSRIWPWPLGGVVFTFR